MVKNYQLFAQLKLIKCFVSSGYVPIYNIIYKKLFNNLIIS